MKEQIKLMADKACRDTELTSVNGGIHITPAFEKFAEMLIKDMLRVVAAHALSGDSAVDVFVNLKRIYEGKQNDSKF